MFLLEEKELINTLYYFFSTIAQSFSALTALVFAFFQFRINWYEQKIKSYKYTLIFFNVSDSHYNGTRAERLFHSMPVQNLIDSEESKITEALIRPNLEETQRNDFINKMEIIKKFKKLLMEFKKLKHKFYSILILGIFLTGVGILGIIFSNYMARSFVFSASLLFIVFLISILYLFIITRFLYTTLCQYVDQVSD